MGPVVTGPLFLLDEMFLGGFDIERGMVEEKVGEELGHIERAAFMNDEEGGDDVLHFGAVLGEGLRLMATAARVVVLIGERERVLDVGDEVNALRRRLV